MPRFFRPQIRNGNPGDLDIETNSEDCVEVFYIPSKERLAQLSIEPRRAAEFRVKLLQIDGRTQRLTVFPTNTTGGREYFHKPKYDQIERITLADWDSANLDVARISLAAAEDSDMGHGDFELSSDEEIMVVLENLPSCFVKDYDYGLGLTQPYRFIVHAVEDLSDCTEIAISNRHQTGVDADRKTFYISTNEFESIRRAIDRTTTTSQIAARSINLVTAHNFFALKLGKPSIPVEFGRSHLRRRITNLAAGGEDPLSQREQDEILNLIAKNTKSIAKTKPRELATLKEDIELVTLETLIERYQEMIKASSSEQKWQVFLNKNPFVLSLAFGYPVIKVRGQASVGGRKLSGAGDKVADFLVKNSMTNNCAIVEIKRPNTKLLNNRTLRNGVYTPSGDLVGAINQALNQKHQFEQQIAQIKENSRIHDIASYSVNCCLLIGTMPSGEDQQRSFELFRGNSKNVEIITFDELLDKLKHLRDFLTSPEVESPF